LIGLLFVFSELALDVVDSLTGLLHFHFNVMVMLVVVEESFDD